MGQDIYMEKVHEGFRVLGISEMQSMQLILSIYHKMRNDILKTSLFFSIDSEYQKRIT